MTELFLCNYGLEITETAYQCGTVGGILFANLCGMVIVLLSVQFYGDVLPVFTQGDSFMKKDYLVVSKKVSTLGSVVGKSSTFSEGDIADMEEQPFTKAVGTFTPARFKVYGGLGVQGMQLSTAMFLSLFQTALSM